MGRIYLTIKGVAHSGLDKIGTIRLRMISNDGFDNLSHCKSPVPNHNPPPIPHFAQIHSTAPPGKQLQNSTFSYSNALSLKDNERRLGISPRKSEIARLTKHLHIIVAEKLHIIPHQHAISKEDRERQNGHKGHVLWFTGLSGSGKSTVASAVERELHQQGIKTFILDGDNVRTGLNSDLDFSAASREENIRRIAHVSALMKDAGLVVLSAFVSPYQKDRDFVRECAQGDFSEIFISTPLEVCEQRDVKGLYAKAKAGEISNFTGISAPFVEPNNPELDVPTHEMSIEEATAMVVDYINTKIALDQ
jgi:adenylylsulfate kinase